MPIRKSNDTLFYLIGIVPVVWLALLLAQSLGGGIQGYCISGDQPGIGGYSETLGVG